MHHRQMKIAWNLTGERVDVYSGVVRVLSAASEILIAFIIQRYRFKEYKATRRRLSISQIVMKRLMRQRT